METKREPKGRKKWIIEPSFQYHFIAFSFVIAAIITAIYFTSIHIFFNDFFAKGVEMGLAPDHVFFRFLEAQKSFMNQVFLVSSGVICAVLFVYSVYFSHRIAGPLYRIKKHILEASKNNELKQLQLRKKDFFQDVADSWNVFAGKDKIQEVQHVEEEEEKKAG